jgi:hypothetical protein
MGNVVLANHDLDVDAGIADESEDFHDPAVGEVGGPVGVAVDLDVDHFPVARLHRGIGSDEDVVVDAHVERHDVGIVTGVKAADHGAMRATEDLHDLAVDVLAVADAADLRIALVDADDHQVAVHGPFDGLAVDVDVRLPLAAEDVAVAVVEDLDRAGVVGRELEQGVALAAHGDDDAVPLELFDGAVDVVFRHIGIVEPLVDVFAAEQTIPALAQNIDDRVMELRTVGGVD